MKPYPPIRTQRFLSLVSISLISLAMLIAVLGLFHSPALAQAGLGKGAGLIPAASPRFSPDDIGDELIPIGGEEASTADLDWGDWDSDGDLDLAVASQYANNYVYENDKGVLSLVWQSDNGGENSSVDWGDWDGDGDLDLAIGSYSEPTRVYENTGNSLSLVWQTAGDKQTLSVAWGDWDGDGDLDLALANANYYNQVYENDGGSDLRLDPGDGWGWEVEEFNFPSDIAWGDYDNDGDLDLAIANDTVGPNQIYENDNGLDLRLDPDNGWGWQQPGDEDTRASALAWADYDNDGDLDLAFSSQFGPNQVYNNDDNGSFSLVLQSDYGVTEDVAWGDWDGDGDLDLTFAPTWETYPLEIYENDAGVLQLDPANGWGREISTSYQWRGAAWGDWDGDGDLDLGLASGDNRMDVVMPNDNGPLLETGLTTPFGNDAIHAWGDWDGDGTFDLAVGVDDLLQVYTTTDGVDFQLAWQASEPNSPRSLGWADYDNDGDLDLAVGNFYELSRVYETDGGTLLLDPDNGFGWEADQVFITDDVAWGDWDNDGDPDLAIANSYANLVVYENNNGSLSLGWSVPLNKSASALSWGDWDGDGDLDLAVICSYATTVVYENDGTTLRLDVAHGFGWVSSVVLESGNDAAWGDWDGDGDLDLAFGSGGESNAVAGIYENIGDDFLTNFITPPAFQIMDVTWGDWDGDGDFDLVTNDPEADGPIIYENRLHDAQGLPNDSPRITNLTTPVDYPYPAADVYVQASYIEDTVISFDYSLSDPENDSVGQLLVYYSPNGGGQWFPAVPTEETVTTNLPTPSSQTFHWDTFASGFFGQTDNMVLRFVALPQPPTTGVNQSYSYTNRLPESGQWPYFSSQTLPFRVRGTQIRVFSDTLPVENAIVYRLPAGQTSGATPLTDSSGTPLRTDSQGYLYGRGQLASGDQLVALLPITGTDKFTLYYSSAAPSENGLAMHQVIEAGVQELFVSADTPLLLFDLDISLEWDARNDDLFLDNLQGAIGRTAETLYDVSNGQIALGDVTVYQNGENWLSSDVVLLASNGIRPRASMGGLVDELTDDVISPTLTISNAYGPGQIRIGPNWDPFGQNQAELTQDWWRAFAHELSHYLLYLPDNYLGLDASGGLVGVDCQGSFMTNTYDHNYSEFLTDNEWSGECLDTVAQRTTGRVDWQTITTFYPWLAAPADPLAGPDKLPLSLIQWHYVEPAGTDNTLSARNLDLREYGSDLISRPQGQGYLIHSQGTADLTDDTVVALGSTSGGGDRVYLRGARPGDRACVFDFSERPAWLGCADNINENTASIELQEAWDWRPNIQVRPVTSTTLAVTVTLADGAWVTGLNLQIYPSYDSPTSTVPAAAPWAAMLPVGDDLVVFTQVITLDYPIFEGWLRVWNPEGIEEAFSQVFLSPPWGPRTRDGCGGGCADSRAWGANDRALGAPVASGDGQVTIFNLEDIYADTGTAALQALYVLPDLPVWLSPVGQGYRFTADAVYSRTIDFDYLQRDVPDGYEHTLHIYYTADEGENWQRLVTNLDKAGNSASAVMPANAVQGQGIYALLSTVDMPTFGPGWNQFGYPLPGSRPIETALASIDGAYSSVYYYDIAGPFWWLYDQTAAWEHPELAPLVNNLERLEFGKSYWLSATESITLYLGVPGGDELGSHILAGVPELPPADFYGWITPTAGFSPAEDMLITANINGVECGYSYVESWQGQLAYEIKVSADNGNGCGAADQTVVFTINDQVMAHDYVWDNSQAHYHPLTTLANAANLAVSQVMLPAGPEADLPFFFVVTVSNLGPLPATGVMLTDTLPAGASYQGAAEAINYCSQTGGQVVCNLGTLAAYQSKTAVIGLVISAAGDYSNTVQVTGSPADAAPADNQEELSFTVGSPTMLSQLKSALDSSPAAIALLWPVAFLLLVTTNVLWQRWRGRRPGV